MHQLFEALLSGVKKVGPIVTIDALVLKSDR